VSRHARITGALVGLVALVVLGWLFTGGERPESTVTGSTAASSSIEPTVRAEPTERAEPAERPLSELPPEVAEVWALIRAGGPFRHEQDGRTFRNDERLLPERPGGHYREYTVPTPGEDDRGARRLVTGRDGELYYTADHYASFVRVATGP
jgi:ribonuclease T1